MKRTTTRSAITCGAALWLLGCGSAPAPESPARRSAAPAPAPRPAAPAAPALGSAPASPFFVVGELHGDLSLYGAGDRGFLISAGGIELQLIGDEIVQDPILKRGLPFLTEAFLAVDGVGGRYPDALWLSTTQPQGRGGFSSLWRWDGKNWRRQEAMNDMHYIYGIQPWVGGRMLALEQSGVAFEASFRVLSGDGRIALPEFTKSPPKKKSDDDGSFSFCITQLKPEVWATLPSGEVFAVGPRCDSAELYQELAVERWAAGARRSNIDIPAGIHEAGDLPAVGYEATGIAALSPTDVFIAASKSQWQANEPAKNSRYFAHFDGAAWQALPTPIPGGVVQLWSSPDGVVFATNEGGELWSRRRDGTWSAMVWPNELRAQGPLSLRGFWPRAAGDAWAVVEASKKEPIPRRYLLHTRPAVNAVPTVEAMDRRDRSLRLPGPPVEPCDTRFVLLYTLARSAPADYDYPATRQALKGHPELAGPAERKTEFVEFEREGRRYFGARVHDFELGEKLARLVKDKVPGSTPQLVCLDPLDQRKLDIDLGTGKLRR